ncbi:MAG: PilZ domain-containing protein [Nitrospirota bacterium]|nr:PilZ domain-containing protein [Nitrospirota bacterium]
MFTKITNTLKKKKVSASELNNENEYYEHVERRSYARFHADLDVRLIYGNLIYAGKVYDVSQNGMFINTKVGFPVNSAFMIVVLLEGRTMKFPIKVRRSAKNYTMGDNLLPVSGIGVELLDAPAGYLEFIGRYWSSKKAVL